MFQPGVGPVRVKAGWPAAFQRPATAKDSPQVVAAVSFGARFLPGLAGLVFLVFALCPVPIAFVTADLVIAAADLVFLAGLGPAGSAVVAGSVAAGLAVDFVAAVFVAPDPDFVVAAFAFAVGFVCSFVAEMGKGRAVVAISCSLIPRSSF